MDHPPRYSEVEGVPLYGHKRVCLPEQPATPGPAYSPGGDGVVAVQHTTVTIVEEEPKDHVVWSLAGLFYANILCFGLAAFICSIKARDRKMVGDMAGAKFHGSKAFWLNVVNTTLAVIMVIMLFVLTFKNHYMAGAISGYMMRRL